MNCSRHCLRHYSKHCLNWNRWEQEQEQAQAQEQAQEQAQVQVQEAPECCHRPNYHRRLPAWRS